MNRLWQVKHVPEFWTLKGLVGLPKKDEVRSVNDIRPIVLIKVTRKLWTAMVLHRLQYVLKKRLQANHCGGLSNKGTDTALIQLVNLLEEAQCGGNEQDNGRAAGLYLLGHREGLRLGGKPRAVRLLEEDGSAPQHSRVATTV
jgi:hypothetical protein